MNSFSGLPEYGTASKRGFRELFIVAVVPSDVLLPLLSRPDFHVVPHAYDHDFPRKTRPAGQLGRDPETPLRIRRHWRSLREKQPAVVPYFPGCRGTSFKPTG